MFTNNLCRIFIGNSANFFPSIKKQRNYNFKAIAAYCLLFGDNDPALL
jgi:hypothetical protein